MLGLFISSDALMERFTAGLQKISLEGLKSITVAREVQSTPGLEDQSILLGL